MDRPDSRLPKNPPITYGDYFSAIQTFLMDGGGRYLTRAVSRQLKRPVTWEDIDAIDITVQKHGAFYHPARVDVLLRDGIASFVTNVAISATGRAGLETEYNLLKQLTDDFTRRYIPIVYHQAVVDGPDIECAVPIFLGEWLDGYHEFHVHAIESERSTIRVWDPQQTIDLNSFQQTRLYHQVAEILTYYYDLETHDQIFPWHHGAGDFVVRVDDDDLEVRLITVRGYSPLVKAESHDAATILEALYRFLLHLSLRTRIDRIDGTGDLVWADESAVAGTVGGFLSGLAAKEPIPFLPAALQHLMAAYLARISLIEYRQEMAAIIATYTPASPEGQLMATHQEVHAECLFEGVTEQISHLSNYMII